MAVTDKVQFQGKRVDLEKHLAFDTVSIRSTIDAKVKVTGTATGNLYVFDRAGAIVSVDIRDKDEILNKKRGRACCGGISGKALFELVEE